MGYYTDVEGEIKILKKDKTAFKNLMDSNDLDESYLDGFWEKNTFRFHASIKYAFSDDDILDKIARFALEGSYIQGRGEEFEDVWEIKFDGEGRWKRRIPRWTNGVGFL